MASVQLIGVRPGLATIRKDDDAPVDLTWAFLHEAQQQVGPVGYVYRWLMSEFCRCDFEQRQGRPWQSPQREVAEIIADLAAQDAREAAEIDAEWRERKARQDAESARRLREDEVRRVAMERIATPEDSPWWPIPEWEIPGGVRFDVPRRNQGQIVERAYGTFGRAEADERDPYMGVLDRSDGSRRWYKRRPIKRGS